MLYNNKTQVGRTMVMLCLFYVMVWTLNTDLKKRLTAVEMDYLRRDLKHQG